MKKTSLSFSRSKIAAALGVCAVFLIVGVAVHEAEAQETVTINATVGGGVTVTIDSVKPQDRVGADQTNDDTDFFVTVRTSNDADDVILFTQPTLETTGADGTFATPIALTGISAGTYDIGFKGHQHLTRVLNDVVLSTGNNVLNFTQADNSAPRGTVELLGGDISGLGTTPATLGDDVVNSVDLSIFIDNIDDDDPTGNTERANINQDVVVNSVDLSIIIDNLDEEGDN